MFFCEEEDDNNGRILYRPNGLTITMRGLVMISLKTGSSLISYFHHDGLDFFPLENNACMIGRAAILKIIAPSIKSRVMMWSVFFFNFQIHASGGLKSNQHNSLAAAANGTNMLLSNGGTRRRRRQSCYYY